VGNRTGDLVARWYFVFNFSFELHSHNPTSGKLQNKIINPKGKRKVKKVYVIEARRPFTGEEEGIFKSGTLKLRGEIEACRPAGFEIVDKEKQIAK